MALNGTADLKSSSAAATSPCDQRRPGLVEAHLIMALTESAPVAIYHANQAGHLTFANPKYREMFKLGPAQSLDDWAQAVHPTDRARIESIWAEFFKAAQSEMQLEYRTQTDAGTRWLAEHVVAVSSQGVSGFVGTIADTTPLREAQAKVEALHRQLVDASRDAGRAEVATSVLHNVGNVLNSINVSAGLILDQVRKSKALQLHPLVDLLGKHSANLGQFISEDPRGRHVPGYLGKLAQQVTLEHGAVTSELTSLQKNVDHIKAIVAMQQSYAMPGGLAEEVEVAGIVEDSLRLNEDSLARHGVTIQRVFAGVPTMMIDKHKVLQILVNLVRNAKYACETSGRDEKVVTVRITRTDAGVEIAVTDNGVGIRAEHLGRIFTHGFTTKKEGHGFGLHSAALIARELGGALRVESDGPGHGASFTLALPLVSGQR
jgi:PAS domain S-box-containing protein